AFLGIFYALLIRPQQQQQKQHAKMVSELKNGTRVIAGGMVGTIISVKKETVTLRTGEAKLEMMRSSVEKILPGNGDIND
ncbi:MAG: preprotein translocase subunit YajC, partial [Verrucomicrobiota bacterium]|nr:preprotein translocase subunit YajC [Verrucomicrobiota bacterium]